MASRSLPVAELTAEERIALMGRLWDSLDPATAAPITDALAAELDRREAEADRNADAGESWIVIMRDLTKKVQIVTPAPRSKR
jgi:putative addiction module component (TIGR02574 family)